MITLPSCSPTEAVFSDQEITLSVDAEVNESWITINPIREGFKYVILRDSIVIFEGHISESKFLFHDQNIEPNTSHTYTVFSLLGKSQSEPVETNVTTMDTTSSNFDISTLDMPSGYFTHCNIWDVDNFWIIGEYYERDSLGTLKPYNILSYENGKWQDIQVKYEAGWSNPLSMSAPTGFWAFDKNNIWFSIYDIIQWTGGIGQIIYNNTEIGGRRYNLFGFENNELYATKGTGPILKITNNEIKEINIPENYRVLDLWGDKDNNLGLSISDFEKGKFVLMFLKDGEIDEEISYNPSNGPGTLWFKTKEKIYVAGSNINVLNRDGTLNENDLGESIFIKKLRGTDINNIFAISWHGKIFHFNGVRWKMIFEGVGTLDNLFVTDELVLVAGSVLGSTVLKITPN